MEDPPIGANVKRIRQRLGLTQQTLAERAGLALKTLSRIENGEDMNTSTLSALAAALDVPAAELFADDIPAA
jgi:transcriptional regulator with XRE-family HTH domain